MSKLLEDNHERILIASSFQENFLVEASAGSGKTHSLVQRILGGLLSGAYQADRLAVVTFTRKAAAELTGRTRLALQTACHGADAARAIRVLADFDKIFIGTIHGFCAQILRQFPIEAGISPGFQEIEEDQDSKLQQLVLRRLLHQPAGRELLYLLGEFDAGLAELQAALNWMSSFAELDYPYPTLQEPPLEQVWRDIENFANFLSAHIPPDQLEPTCKLLSASYNLLQYVAETDRTTPKALIRLLEEWETEPKVVQKYWGSNRVQRQQNLDCLLPSVQAFRQQIVLPQLSQWRSYLYSQIVGFVQIARQQCLLQRQQNGMVNFHDLLGLACQLVTSSALRSRLQARFTHICVDEFQDTDPLQAKLLFLLCADDLQETCWTKTRPRPGSLFLVGDPKQSIYRFRRADIQIYNQARRIIADSGGRVLYLKTSFRSTASLCAWINQAFTQILPVEATTQQAAYTVMHAPDLDRSVSVTPIERLIDDSQRYSEVVFNEAERLADWIKSKLRSGYVPSDFLILTARKKELIHYHTALQRLQIPCEMSGEPVYLSAQGKAFLRLLQVLSNAHDRTTLVGVLRGPFFGLSDAQLFQSFYQKEANRVDEVLQSLQEMRQAVSSLLPGAVAGWVCRKLSLQLNDDFEINSINNFLSQRGQLGLTLTQCLTELLEFEAVPFCPGFGGYQGVRLMNVHKAKGLEARVVVLAAPTAGLPLKAEHSVMDNKGYFCLYRSHKYKSLACPDNWPEIEKRELEFVRAEHLRLLYVAATRARETLLICQWSGKHASASRPWVALDPWLGEVQPVTPESLLEEPSSLIESENVADVLAQAKQQAEFLEICKQPGWQRYSVTINNKSKLVQCAAQSGDDSIGGTAWGELIHRLLEQLVRQPKLDKAQLLCLAHWFSLETAELQPYLQIAVDTVEKVRQSEFWSRVINARQRLVEVPFGQAIGRDLLFGIIDLALEQAEGWEIVDYKTDQKNLQQLISTYAGQVAQYASSWQQISQQKVEFAGIYAVRELKLSEDLKTHGDQG